MISNPFNKEDYDKEFFIFKKERMDSDGIFATNYLLEIRQGIRPDILSELLPEDDAQLLRSLYIENPEDQYEFGLLEKDQIFYLMDLFTKLRQNLEKKKKEEDEKEKDLLF